MTSNFHFTHASDVSRFVATRLLALAFIQMAPTAVVGVVVLSYADAADTADAAITADDEKLIDADRAIGDVENVGVSHSPAHPTFEKDIRPIFKAACFHCHGEEPGLRGGLDLRLVRRMRIGGESGPAVSSTDLASNLLWRRIDSDEMPDGPKKLTAAQKQIVARWLLQGATTARPEPQSPEDARFTLEELEHWSFQPLVRAAVPTCKDREGLTPVDRFIARELGQRNLRFNSRAEPGTLIRRATIDLTGLPPTADDVRQFVGDVQPDAYARLLDQLLASPRFGVRWARHWLDVVGYAETNGGSADNDIPRPHAWRYRDYVIDSFNANKPIDEFFREQLSGDELVPTELDPYNPQQLELLTATGFLRMAPDPTQHSNTLADRNMAVADTVRVVSSAMLGITLGCAQCHDHKYDPITIDDYYRFRAIFDPAFPLHDWQTPDQRLVDLTPAEVRAEAEQIEAQARARDEDLIARRENVAREIQERTLADVPEDVRQQTRAAVLAEPSQRSPRDRELLDQYPMVKPINHIIGLLVEYDGPTYRKFERELAEIASLRATKPPLTLVMATRERRGVVPRSTVFFRGNPETPGEEVLPGELQVLRRSEQVFTTGEGNDQQPSATTGRRRAFARYLTSGRHPLTGRVFVNRVWHHHLGRGLVASLGDFGLSGDQPTHSELLDWLASRFQDDGWDQKRLHRLLMLSATYQQHARRSRQFDSIDPQNLLWGRSNVRRMEAEVVRDALLAVSDSLNEELGGPSVPVTKDGEGRAVIGRTRVRDGLPAGVQGQASHANRRSIFIEVQRNLPLELLGLFDEPVMNPNCEQRATSTAATQSLWFMNDDTLIEQADLLARCVFSHPGRTSRERLDELFLRLFASPANGSEQESCGTFLASQRERFRADDDAVWQEKIKASPTELEIRAWSSLCQVLLASNRFLYVD